MRSWLLSNISVYIIANILFAYFLVGCQPIQRSGVSTSNSTVSGHSSATTSGPIDSGGENLINGVPLESYRVDVTKLDEFKIVKQALHYASVAYKHDFTDFAKMKNWYFVPVSLADLSNRSVGIDLKNGTTQTIALQGRDEIWIDDNLYKKQSTEEKAKIILHEVVRTMNGMKYLSVKELCRNWLRADNTCEMFQLAYNDTKEMQPLASPDEGDAGDKIREQDTASIRDMTMWMLDLNDNVLLPEIRRRFQYFDFDRRYFEYEQLLWPYHYVNISIDENNFLIEQILDFNNIPNARGDEKKLVFDVSPSSCSINFVDPGSANQSYYVVPDKNDPSFNFQKTACLQGLGVFSRPPDLFHKTTEANLRWIYGSLGPMVLYIANLAAPTPIRIDPLSKNSATLARDKVEKFSTIRRGYFLFAPTKTQNFTIKDLQLIAADSETMLKRSNKDFGYVAETIQKDKVLFCVPNEYGTPDKIGFNSIFNDGFHLDRKNLGFMTIAPYIFLANDPLLRPSCSIKDISEIANLSSQPDLFSSLKKDSSELIGEAKSNPAWQKEIADAESAINALDQCEHPQPGSTIVNPCGLPATTPPQN